MQAKKLGVQVESKRMTDRAYVISVTTEVELITRDLDVLSLCQKIKSHPIVNASRHTEAVLSAVIPDAESSDENSFAYIFDKELSDGGFGGDVLNDELFQYKR